MRKPQFRIGVLAAVGALAAATLVGMAASPASAASSVTVAGHTRALDGTNVRRLANYLVMYTPAFGARTGTNQFGYEATVVGGSVTLAQNGVGNMAIPSNGYVLSGHGTARTFLNSWAKVGADVTLDGGGGGGGQTLLPDLGVRRLNDCPHKPCFIITTVGGIKELKFPVVTANVGVGPFETRGTRSSSTSSDWTATQTIFHSDGSTTNRAAPGVDFFYAGDGHNHWHIRDLDSYELLDAGAVVAEGEKHGFCFEDNTSYRDWPSTGHNGAPRNPVYAPDNVCGVGQPSATSVMHGLSVGWGDTYPTSLPNQYIDITGLPDGVYTVRVSTDQANWFQETNDSNNFASAQIQITGSSVTVVSQGAGL